MTRYLVILGLWAVMPAPGQVGMTAIYTEFESRPATGVFQALQDEVATLMASQGIHFVWKSLPAEDHAIWGELAVVKLSGRCEVLPTANHTQRDNRLGWTHISDGEVLPFAEVDCEAIRAFVLRNLFLLRVETREKVYGRAVGRVVAHELLHIFARTADHSSHGVDQATLTVSDLLGDHLVWNANEPDLHIVRPGTEAIGRSDGGSADEGRSIFLRNGCPACHGPQGQGSALGPALRQSGQTVDSTILAAKLTKHEEKMNARAHSLKIAPPRLPEDEITDLARFLNEVGQ